MKFSQLAVGNYHYPLYSFEYFLSSMQRMGIRRIELWAAGPHFYLDDFTPERTARLAGQIRSCGMEVACLTPEQCAYPISISVEDPVMRRRSIAYFKKAIDAAVVLESPKVLVTPGRSMVDFDRETGVRLCIEALRELADYAGQRGVLLVLEALARTTTFIAHTPAELQVLLDGVGDTPWLRPMLDTDGAARENLTSRDFLDAFGERLAHVHFIDGFPGGHVVPGDGALDMARYLRELDEGGYSGDIVLEVLDRRYYREPEEATLRCLRWLEKYMEQGS